MAIGFVDPRMPLEPGIPTVIHVSAVLGSGALGAEGRDGLSWASLTQELLKTQR